MTTTNATINTTTKAKDFEKGSKFAIAMYKFFKEEEFIKDPKQATINAVKKQHYSAETESYLIKLIQEDKIL